jgi:hypothetical protein
VTADVGGHRPFEDHRPMNINLAILTLVVIILVILYIMRRRVRQGRRTPRF